MHLMQLQLSAWVICAASLIVVTTQRTGIMVQPETKIACSS